MTMKLTQEEFERRIQEQGKGEYTVKGKYKGRRIPVETVHSCGYVWGLIPDSFFNGHRCPKCAGRPVVTTEEYRRKVASIDGDYKVIGEYVNRRSKILMKHISKNHLFECSPAEFLKGNRCSICSQSMEEQNIARWLDDNEIRFVYQKRFEDCKDNKVLPFDFYLPDINVCIEYDGSQHYTSNNIFGGTKEFDIRHKHDLMKTIYCAQQDIYLIRIPYTGDINDFLSAHLQAVMHAHR